EAKYIAITLAVKEAVALIRLLEELRADNIVPVTIYKDLQLAIDLLKRIATNSRTKYIDIR
ncbi:MAG: hypothetical protein FE78DRAFT_137941, partial [Acidomyces sp. 'richmondensis']